MSLRASVVGLALLGLGALPVIALVTAGVGASELLGAALAGFVAAVDSVGWVFVPQFVLAVAVLSLALQQIFMRMAGHALPAAPAWLDPAVESALLLGLLGTVSGMVQGFAGISPEQIEPGPLVHSLGRALRSTFVGFSIGLVGVWAKVASLCFCCLAARGRATTTSNRSQALPRAAR